MGTRGGNGDHNAFERGLVVGTAMARGQVVTSAWLRETLAVSRPTAKRLMHSIEGALRASATEGEHGQVSLRLATTTGAA